MTFIRNLIVGAAFASAISVAALVSAHAEVPVTATGDTTPRPLAATIGVDAHTTTNSGINRENPAVGTNKAAPTSDVTVQGTLSPAPMGAAPATQNLGGTPSGDTAKNNTARVKPPSCHYEKDSRGVWRERNSAREVTAADAQKAGCAM